MHPFERALLVSTEDIEIELRDIHEISWADFLLNPRRLRGSDFLMRWSQGVWSETRLMDAVNRTNQFFAIPYGPSGTARRMMSEHLNFILRDWKRQVWANSNVQTF